MARQCSSSSMIEYLAVDTGGYMFPNSYHAFNAVSLGVFYLYFTQFFNFNIHGLVYAQHF